MSNNTVKKKCGFLAIGAGGGNVCVPFYKAAYPSLFINSAKLDLDSLTEVDRRTGREGWETECA